MAVVKSKELGKMSDNDLNNKLIQLRKELMKLRGKASSGVAPENPGKINAVRKAIARLLTEKNLRGGLN